MYAQILRAIKPAVIKRLNFGSFYRNLKDVSKFMEVFDPFSDQDSAQLLKEVEVRERIQKQ